MKKSLQVWLGVLLLSLIGCTTTNPDDPNASDIVKIETEARGFASEGKYAEGIAAYEQSLTWQAATLHLNPSRFANTETQLAGLYYRQRDFATAARLYRHALQLEIERLGIQHPDVLGLMSILASLELKLQHPETAERILRLQLSGSERVYGVDRRESATIFVNLAEALDAQGKPAEAKKLREKAQEIRHKLCDEC